MINYDGMDLSMLTITIIIGDELLQENKNHYERNHLIGINMLSKQTEKNYKNEDVLILFL